MTTLDARALITEDLAARRRERAQHFRAAWVLAVLIPALGLLATGVRGDLWQQPAWVLGLQLLVWPLALFALPAIGLGLWFPGRAARVALGVLAAAVAVAVAAGPVLFDMSYAPGPEDHPAYRVGCALLTLGAGALVLAVCALSGAFAQRRRRAAGLWLAAAIALIGVETTTWHCVIINLDHTLPSHLGAGVLMLLLAGLVGAALHRRQRGGA
ncbi:MAG TPA: hypothetical protein VIK91_21295 [Nannocystis sp.]